MSREGSPEDERTFEEALAADVVIPGLTESGPLPASGILATRSFFDERQKQLRAADAPDDKKAD